MTKLQVLDIKGNKTKEIESQIFDGPVRRDIVQKIVEIERLAERQANSPFYLAGMQTSASGNVKHNRHVWKTDRGRGLSRYPKKRMSDKGSNFVWVAAVAPGVRGGRRAHPPKIERKYLKINRKEKTLGFLSALSMVASFEELKQKYQSISEMKNSEFKAKLPIVLEEKALSLKSKEIFKLIESIIGKELMNVAIQTKETRPGRGKMRGRRYKKNAGLLVITANDQEKKMNGIDIKKVKDLKLKDLASQGARLAIFTEESIKELEKKVGQK